MKKIILTGPCGICEQIRRLTRDHDHKTKMIRGLLCNDCNSRLAAIEQNQSGKKPSWFKWKESYNVRISWWLLQNTGVEYSPWFWYDVVRIPQYSSCRIQSQAGDPAPLPIIPYRITTFKS